MSIAITEREKKSELTANHLSETAMSLFRQYGFDRVTIDDICSHCNVTKGAFYYHFPSKEHIISYGVNHELDNYVTEHFVLNEEDSLSEQLISLQECAFSYFREAGRDITQYSYVGQVQSMIDLKIPHRAYVSTLSGIINRCVEENAFKSQLDSDNCYMMNIMAFTGFLLKWCSVPDDRDHLYKWDIILKDLISSLFC
ncbi:MAG: TetR/AcrR family transcriptional regulator [Lachnospiraceae bacterium]|nr:TetR/AcrR family transcriptional regulator [Lachnospiraceae bacterium]